MLPVATAHMTVFGLDLAGPRPLAGLAAGAEGAGRRVEMAIVEDADRHAGWRPDGAPRLVDLAYDDGTPFLTVDGDPGRGYRVDAPGFGRHVIGPGATTIASELPDGDRWRWQRLLFAQALPALAALGGIATLHAAAVSVGGRVLALTGRPGTGKTSTSTHLLAQGAGFVTDDVLCVERLDGTLCAHVGPQFASVHAHELAKLDGERRRRLGTVVGESDKLHVLPEDRAEGPQPLAAWCFLERGGAGDDAEVEPVRASAADLLAAAYLPWAQSADRLLAQLETCSAMAAEVAVLRVRSPDACPAERTAAALLQWMEGR